VNKMTWYTVKRTVETDGEEAALHFEQFDAVMNCIITDVIVHFLFSVIQMMIHIRCDVIDYK